MTTTDRENELLNRVPVEFRSGLYHRAYEMGHSGGQENVLTILEELVDMIVGPLEKYTNRIK